MTLEEIGRHIKDIEAITQYKRVMKERDDAINREREVEEELSKSKKESNQRIGALTSQNEGLNNTLRCTKEELQTSNNLIKDKENELKAKNQTIDQIHLESKNQLNKIKELEELNVLAQGMTLSEVEKAVLKATDEEIDRRAQQKSLIIAQNWRTNDKPKEVEAQALVQLEVILGLLAGQTRSIPPSLSGSNLPNMVLHALQREIDSRLWPQWYRTTVEPRVKELEDKIQQNVFTVLKGPWPVKCSVCDTEADCELDDPDVENLIKYGLTRVQCPNPNCRNHGPFFAIRKRLTELINDHVTKPMRRPSAN